MTANPSEADMMRLVRLVLPAVALLLGGTTPPYGVLLDAERCLPLAPQQLAELGPAWIALARFAQRCPVHGPDGRLALSVDTIRFDRARAVDYFRTHTVETVPTPILRDAAGVPIGGFPENFPTDRPNRVLISFVDWRDGFPHEIRRDQEVESALPLIRLPSMHWNPRVRRYE